MASISSTAHEHTHGQKTTVQPPWESNGLALPRAGLPALDLLPVEHRGSALEDTCAMASWPHHRAQGRLRHCGAGQQTAPRAGVPGRAEAWAGWPGMAAAPRARLQGHTRALRGAAGDKARACALSSRDTAPAGHTRKKG